jgi:tetratricopeptide (TPR) repeat protein
LEIAAANDWEDVPRDSIWTATLYRAAETCVRLGDKARAARLYEMLLPFAERPIVVGRVASVYLGANSRLLGLLAATMGRRQEAAQHFEHALALDARMGAHPWVAQSQLDYARVLASDDPRRASELLDQALETARELGMVSVARQVEEARAAV